MSTSIDSHASLSPAPPRTARLGGVSLVLGGLTFFAGGVTHPSDSGGGSKVEQLYEALVQPAWYPSHALLLTSFALFATAIVLLRKRGDLDDRMRRVVDAVSVLFVVAALGMAVHLFAALGAESIADGHPSLIYEVQTWNETILNALWGVGIIALAVTGGLTGTLGNRIIMPIGVVGGAAWCLAAATIAFTDLFDGLFPIAGTLIPIWAIAAGVRWAGRTT